MYVLIGRSGRRWAKIHELPPSTCMSVTLATSIVQLADGSRHPLNVSALAADAVVVAVEAVRVRGQHGEASERDVAAVEIGR